MSAQPADTSVEAMPFAGLSVLVTGAVPGMSRDAARNAVIDLGGKPVGSVSASTSLVVVGDGAGVSKMVKVRALGLMVVGAAAFADLVADLSEDPSAWVRAGSVPVGEPVSTWDAVQPEKPVEEPRPGMPRLDVPLADQHLVSLAAVSVPVATETGRVGYELQYRRSCSCGHRWLGRRGDTGQCPIESGQTRVVVASAPWANLSAGRA